MDNKKKTIKEGSLVAFITQEKIYTCKVLSIATHIPTPNGWRPDFIVLDEIQERIIKGIHG